MNCDFCGQKAGSGANCAECVKQRERWAGMLGGARALQKYVAEGFTPVTDAAKLAFSAAKAFDAGKQNLYLHGPTGAGKTRLAIIAARRYLPYVTTATAAEVICSIMEHRRGLDELAEVKRFALSRVLVLDELGLGEGSAAQVTKLYDVVNRRYRERAGGLIVTSNLNLDELAQAFGDDRITSRLAELCRGGIFDLTGEPDHRLEARP